MASTTMSRASGLGQVLVTVAGEQRDAVEDFAVFIDTHRDQPHVGSFEDDIHRGQCRPTLVHLIVTPNATTGVPDYTLWRNEDGKKLKLHEKHRFVTVDWWRGYIIDAMAANGVMPLDAKGFMPTSHLRDARAKKYMLKSFRQVVVDRQNGRP